jgi:hypothetical protein
VAKRRMGPLHCVLNVGRRTAQIQRNEHLCVIIALQNNKEPSGAIETTYQIFIACSY